MNILQMTQAKLSEVRVYRVLFSRVVHWTVFNYTNTIIKHSPYGSLAQVNISRDTVINMILQGTKKSGLSQ